MKNLGRYLNRECINFGSNSIKKILNLNGLPNQERAFTKYFLRRYAENKSKQESTDSDKSSQEQLDKKTKHIYKKKEQNLAKDENSDIIRKESHFFREGFSNGIHIREEVSYVCYELPSEGKAAGSTGKSEDREKSEKNQNKESSKNVKQ